VEVSALKHPGVTGIHGRSPLLRLQSDERLIALVRRGNHGAFEALVSRYQARLLAFCRHMLNSREDAEDVLQEVFAAAFNAILADERAINARPWLYRIARNRSLNHLRRVQPIGVDSMDVHLAEHGTTTADKVEGREQFRELIADVQLLPETQRTALLLREIDALSYEQIAEAMETTIPSVKSLLVRARVSLAEAAEARQLSCEEVRFELGEIAEGLRRRTTAPVRRHLRSCDRCGAFRTQLKSTNKALAAIMPVGALFVAKKLFLAHLGWSASAGGHATGTAAAGGAAAAAGGAAAGSATSSLISAGIGAVATKAAAGIAAAALVTAGAVEIEHTQPRRAATARHAVAKAPPHATHATPQPAITPQPAVIHQAPARVQRALEASSSSAVRPAAPRPHGTDRTTASAPHKRPGATNPKTTTPTKPTAPATGTTTATTPSNTTATATPQPGQTVIESSTTTLPSALPPGQAQSGTLQSPPPASPTTTGGAAAPPATTPPPTTTTTTLPATQPAPTTPTPAPPAATTPTTPAAPPAATVPTTPSAPPPTATTTDPAATTTTTTTTVPPLQP
jgi:RNA polymerase sigma factor (sigma-70 family)